jgi:hypothetical protein
LLRRKTCYFLDHPICVFSHPEIKFQVWFGSNQ